jgi:biopolymer transport protein ExbD
MWLETERTRPRRRRALELAITPLIDIVFLLLIFFMLTSRFVMQEGIEVQLPMTEKTHTVPSEGVKVIYVRSDGSLVFEGAKWTLSGFGNYLSGPGKALVTSPFEVRSDRQASIQSIVSLLETLRERGVGQVIIGTVRAEPGSEKP